MHITQPATHITAPTTEAPAEYAILELKGRTRMGARISQTERWGLRGIRVEVLSPDRAEPIAVKVIPPSSVHCLTLCTEEQARRVEPVEAVPFEMGERSTQGLAWPLDAFARQVQALVETDHGTPTVRGIVADLEAFVVASKVALDRGDEDAVAEMGTKIAALAYALHQFGLVAF